MTRSIDIDDFGPTIEEKFFLYSKRICVGFAVAAVSISALDLMNVGAVERVAESIRDSRLHYAEMPARILTGIRQISIMPDRGEVTVAIPRTATASLPAVAALPKVEPKSEPKIALAPAPRIAAVAPPAARIASAPALAPVAAPAIAPARSAESNASPVAELADARHTDAVEFAMALPAATNADSFKLASLDTGSLPGNLPAPVLTPVSLPVSLPMSAAIPLNMVPLPTPAPPPSPAQRLHLEGKDYTKAERCLANAIYWEARSEPVKGQEAVAQVVMNRVFSGFYPGDVCSVVYQNASRHLACQFTFACDGKRKVITERGHWARANRIAKQTLDGQIYVPEVAKSTHYHAVYVHPNWVREMKKMVRFGVHNFYRPYAWGNGAGEPVWGKTAMATYKKK